MSGSLFHSPCFQSLPFWGHGAVHRADAADWRAEDTSSGGKLKSGLPTGISHSPQSYSFGEFDTGQNDEWRPVSGVQGHSPDTPFSRTRKRKSVFCFFYLGTAGDGRDS